MLKPIFWKNVKKHMPISAKPNRSDDNSFQAFSSSWCNIVTIKEPENCDPNKNHKHLKKSFWTPEPNTQPQIVRFNSLAPGNFKWNFIYVIFQGILVIGGRGIACEIALIWMSVDFTDDQSTLVQVMAWCRKATSHYLIQYWPSSMSPYGVTRPQWV